MKEYMNICSVLSIIHAMRSKVHIFLPLALLVQRVHQDHRVLEDHPVLSCPTGRKVRTLMEWSYIIHIDGMELHNPHAVTTILRTGP